MTLLIILIIAIIAYAAYQAPFQTAHKRTPPPGMETDWSAMQRDIGSSMSKRDINIKIINGAYDIPKK